MPSVSRPQHNLMEGVAHNAAFAKRVGISQKVGRDFASADKATGKFRTKEPKMAKHGDGMDGSKGMSPRKAMASGLSKGGEGFGVEPFHEVNGHEGGRHPDHLPHRTGEKGAMMDHERGAPPAVHHTKGHLPAQAAPDHGHTHPHGHGHHHTYDHEKA